jgi:predicted Fe-Mo cluster-binding NifX family protein
MRLLMASKGKGLDSEIDRAFGRCPFFAVVDLSGGKIAGHETVENAAQGQRGGAGITAAQTVGNLKPDAVVVLNIGPKAFGVMEQLGIRCYKGIEGTVRQNVERFLSGALEELSSPLGGRGQFK